MGQGKQDNESAIEQVRQRRITTNSPGRSTIADPAQAKDEQISDFIRGQYKSNTGSDFPIKDKDTKLG